MADVCAVCLEPLDPTCAALPCSHRFHVVCMVGFARHDVRCPVCRAPAVSTPAASAPASAASPPGERQVVLLLQDARVVWRRYVARRRRLLRREPTLQHDFTELQAVRAQMGDTINEMHRTYSERCREVWRSDPGIAAQRRALGVLRRRHRRLEVRVHDALADAIGPEPFIEL